MASANRVASVGQRLDFIQGEFLAMGSPCEVLLDTKDETIARRLIEIASTEAWRIEDKFSRYLPDSITQTINTAGGTAVCVDDETADLIDFAVSLYDLSEGRFDISSGALRRVWKFDGGSNVPDDADIQSVLDTIGWEKASWRRPEITLQAEMQIDFGGIGKEYAVDKVVALLLEQADIAFLVNFGGDVYAAGHPLSQEAWQVGIASVDTEVTRIIQLKQGALATSGDARRFVLKDGVRYGHVLDPNTGWPVAGAPRSVTVAADTCTEAGMLATLAILQGLDAEEFLEQQSITCWISR